MAQTYLHISAFPWGLQTTIPGCAPAPYTAISGFCLGKNICMGFWSKPWNCLCKSTHTPFLYLGSRGHTWRKSTDSKDILLSQLHCRLCPLQLTSSRAWGTGAAPDAKGVSPSRQQHRSAQERRLLAVATGFGGALPCNHTQSEAALLCKKINYCFWF